VAVLAVGITANQLGRDLAELVDRMGESHAEDAPGRRQSLVVLAEPEKEELALVLVPVAPDALEAPGPVVEGVRHDVDVCLGQRNERSAEICLWLHGRVSSMAGTIRGHYSTDGATSLVASTTSTSSKPSSGDGRSSRWAKLTTTPGGTGSARPWL